MDVQIKRAAVRQAFDLGIGTDKADTYKVLEMFVRQSAICTHELGTRRYGAYVLGFNRDGALTGVYRANPHEIVCNDCFGTGTHKVWEHIPGGDRLISIPCQSCAVVFDK